MELTTLGRSHLTVSRIGLGLAALGRPGYINLGHAEDLARGRDVAAMAAHAATVLDAAWAGGVRYFDAARSYGRAEAFLASWLADRQVPPDAVTVGTKWGYTYTADWQVEADRHEVKSHTRADLLRQVAESRATLGPHFHLDQIHSATRESGVLENAEVLRELAQLRAGGLRIGLSTSGPNQAETIRQATEIVVDGTPLFDTVQATWNLLEPSAGTALAEAHAAGLGVIVKEALANGRLTARNVDPTFQPARDRLAAVARRCHATLDAVALAAVLAQPWAGVVLSGAGSVEQLRSNLAALAIPADAGISDELASLAEPPDAYWSTRSRLPWN